MKIKQLKEILEGYDEESEVFVLVEFLREGGKHTRMAERCPVARYSDLEGVIQKGLALHAEVTIAGFQDPH